MNGSTAKLLRKYSYHVARKQQGRRGHRVRRRLYRRMKKWYTGLNWKEKTEALKRAREAVR